NSLETTTGNGGVDPVAFKPGAISTFLGWSPYRCSQGSDCAQLRECRLFRRSLPMVLPSWIQCLFRSFPFKELSPLQINFPEWPVIGRIGVFAPVLTAY